MTFRKEVGISLVTLLVVIASVTKQSSVANQEKYEKSLLKDREGTYSVYLGGVWIAISCSYSEFPNH